MYQLPMFLIQSLALFHYFYILKKISKKPKSYKSSYLNKLIINQFEDIVNLSANYEFNKEIFLGTIYDNKYISKFNNNYHKKIKMKEKKI